MAIVDGHIRCSRCRTLKPVSAYAPSAAKNGYGNYRACQQLYARAYEKANPEKVRAQRRAAYGRNIEASRAKMRDKQAARRAANPDAVRAYDRRYRQLNAGRMNELRREFCKRDPERAWSYDLKKYRLTPADYEHILAAQGGGCACCGVKANRSGRRLFVDHDHETGAVRGLLCNACNAGIGHLGDTVDGVRLALNYLERAAQQPPMRAAPALRINLLQGAN